MQAESFNAQSQRTPTEEERERLWHLESLLRLGNVTELNLQLDSPLQLRKQLHVFDEAWTQYNPYKPQINRKGLSITSLDGMLTGEPDLYSLQEYAKRTGKLYRESDFNKLTAVYEFVPAIHRVIDYFAPNLGRCHFLKFGAGGFFPPHRDAAMMEVPDCFRLLIPVFNAGPNSSAFVLDGKILPLTHCSVYVINTLLVHSLFSYVDDVVYMVCNIPINATTVHKAKSILLSK